MLGKVRKAAFVISRLPSAPQSSCPENAPPHGALGSRKGTSSPIPSNSHRRKGICSPAAPRHLQGPIPRDQPSLVPLGLDFPTKHSGTLWIRDAFCLPRNLYRLGYLIRFFVFNKALNERLLLWIPDKLWRFLVESVSPHSLPETPGSE